MTSEYNHGLSDPIFRDGRWVTAGAFVGSLLIAIGCFGGWFTAFEIDEGTWESRLCWRFGFVFLFFFAGFFSIFASMLRLRRMVTISGVVSAAIAFVIACFPSGIQLVAGPSTYTGEIQSIVVPSAQNGVSVKPMSGTYAGGVRQPKAIVTMVLENGERVILKIGCRNLLEHLGGEVYSLSGPRSGTWKLVYLPYLDRVLTLRQE
ncbi:MAG: hypothetical protein AB8B55_01210 [Mariniblastus sp.]